MGCPKHLYNPDQESSPFLGVWKKELLENANAHFLGTPDEKSRAENFCDSYLPFGLAFNSWTTGTQNNYLYNQGSEKTHLGGEGKIFKGERQLELDVDMTRYRTYDYAIGRFWQIDPLADSANQENQTPYHYVRNNPINYNDPLGDCDICIPLGRFKRKVVQLYNEWRNGTDAIPGGTQVVNNGSPGPEASQTISLEGHDETEQPYTGVADRWGSPTSRAKSIAEAGHRINQIIPNELTDLDNGGDQEDSNQSSSRGSVKDGDPVQFLLYSNEGLDISGHMMYDSIWENVDPITGDIDTTGTRTRPGRIGAGGPVNMTKEMIKDFLKK